MGFGGLPVKVFFRKMEQVDAVAVQEHLPLSITTDTTGIVAYDLVSRETVAVFVCQDWTSTSVQVHQVILNPMVLRHGFLEECATYVFTQAGRLKMYGLVPENNKRALSVNRKIGFKELVRLEDAADVGVDYVLMELKREDCPYWKPVNELAA